MNEVTIHAHLCEVSRLVVPEEDGRDPRGIPRRRHGVGYESTARPITGTTLPASSTGPWRASSACIAKATRNRSRPDAAEVIEIGNAPVTASVIPACVNVRKPRRGPS